MVRSCRRRSCSRCSKPSACPNRPTNPFSKSPVIRADGENREADSAEIESAALSNPEPAAEIAAVPDSPELLEQKPASDPFDEIDFGTYFDEYLDPGYKSPAVGKHRKAVV